RPRLETLSLHDALPIFLAARDLKDDAEAAVREAIGLHQRGRLTDPLALARDQAVLGQIAFGRGDLDGAEQAMREALVLRIAGLRSEEHTSELQSREKLV